MKQYLELVERVLTDGERREDRTGTGTLSIFGAQTRYDLREGFPLLTTKKVLWTGVVRELLWFLRGSTNVRQDLSQHTPIWDAWADPNGELGPGVRSPMATVGRSVCPARTGQERHRG
nr:thymidylate synthase [uncultured bacterium]